MRPSIQKMALVYVSLVVLGLWLSNLGYARIDPDDIIGVWLFDEDSGKTIKDSSGNGNDGEALGKFNRKPGKFGGGFEFALACKFIVAVDHDSTSFSLPEVKLGIYPGWGGIKRLPQRVGIFQGLSLMLSGKFLNARKAFKAGVADVLVPERTADLACERLIKQNPILINQFHGF